MEDRHRLLNSLRFPTLFVAVMWVVRSFEFFTHTDLTAFGNYPRTLHGMIGIASSPFIHGDWPHLMSNSLPVIILGSLIIYFYPTASKKVIAGIYFLTGAAVWLLARQTYHIGASGLVYGFAFFLFFSGVFRNDMKSLAISFFTIFMYGGIVWGLMPSLIGISWESHLFGAISGSLLAYLFRFIDLQPKEEFQFDEPQPEISYRYIYLPKEPSSEPPATHDDQPDDEKGNSANR